MIHVDACVSGSRVPRRSLVRYARGGLTRGDGMRSRQDWGGNALPDPAFDGPPKLSAVTCVALAAVLGSTGRARWRAIR